MHSMRQSMLEVHNCVSKLSNNQSSSWSKTQSSERIYERTVPLRAAVLSRAGENSTSDRITRKYKCGYYLPYNQIMNFRYLICIKMINVEDFRFRYFHRKSRVMYASRTNVQ